MSPVTISVLLLRDDDSTVPLEQSVPPAGTWSHVRGVVELLIDGQPVMDRAWWDDLDWLWPFFVTAVDKLLTTGEGEILYPSQPIQLRLGRIGGDRVLVSTVAGEDTRRATCRREDLVAEVQRAGEVYWSWVMEHYGPLKPGEQRLLETLRSWSD
ncbi:hypothetical protein [Euzebya tangerina]|uniref:hypothetical protein n=1 Tax=Euzebya tangerina TaxID=591198 RepID=UPI000E31C3E2|nr:hypothetical protein [Euzebya tangerina]